MSRTLRWCFMGLSMVFAHVQAAPILLVDGTGKLTGATGVDVGGTLYDVEFLDGTCIAVFSGCDAPADFTFTTQAASQLASSALLAQVFLDVPAGNFDTVPTLTRGCEAGRVEVFCAAITPSALPSPGLVSNTEAVNWGTESFDASIILSVPFPTNLDLSSTQSATWARWSPAEQSAPEPGTIAILGAGLLAMIMTRRRRTETLDRIQ